MSALDWLFGGAGALPPAQWPPALMILYVVAEAVIAASSIAIPLGIAWYMRRRRGMPYQYQVLAWSFGAFVGASGLIQLLDAVAVWHPVYGLVGLAKGVTAAISGATVALVWPLLPGLVRLPSSRQLAEVNARLRQEVESHEATLRDLEDARRDLETPVNERTAELSQVTARLETALRGATIHESEQRRLTEELGTAVQRYEIALRGSNVTVYTQDRALRYTSVSGPVFGRRIDEIVGHFDQDILPVESLDPILALKRQVLESGVPQNGELHFGDGSKLRWYDMHIEPLRGIAGGVVGLTCAAVDITASKAAEANLRDLMRELTHRSKNLLAVIQAMARQTARHAATVESFLDRFGERLRALADSHDLLVQDSWYGASLSDLVRSQLAPYLDREDTQVAMEGPALLLKPEAAQALGLALHELATNAAKYGALSVPGGRVAITWRHAPPPAAPGIEIVWSESGGPLVEEPKWRGFGSHLIEQNLAHSLEAEISLAFPPQGVRCNMTIPASNLAPGR